MRVRASLDSNILVYAALELGSDKGKRAAGIIARTSPHGILAPRHSWSSSQSCGGALPR